MGSEGWESLVPWYTGLEVSGRGGHLLCGCGGGRSLHPSLKASGEHGEEQRVMGSEVRVRVDPWRESCRLRGLEVSTN